MTWEEKLLFLMFLDYKGALKKWERNHNKDKSGFSKIESGFFYPGRGFSWCDAEEGDNYWLGIIMDWNKSSKRTLKVKSLDFEIAHTALKDTIQVGCQSITKKDALKIADFIYECFGESA